MFGFIKKWTSRIPTEPDCSQYIDLETPCLIDPNALITRQGVRLTLIRINGSMNILGGEDSKEFAGTCKAILSLLKTFYASDYVELGWMYKQAPDKAMEEISDITRPSVNSAKLLGFDVENVMQEMNLANSELAVPMDNVIALWSLPKTQYEYINGDVLPVKTDNLPLMNIHKDLFDGSANPFLSDSQNIATHKKNVDLLLDKLRNSDIVCAPIKAKKAAQWLLKEINPSKSKYTPLQFVDDTRIGIPTPGAWMVNPETSELDLSDFIADPLSEQLARHSIEEVGNEGILKVEDTFFGTHTVDVMPKQEIPFSHLQKALKGVPFRITFLLKPKPSDTFSVINERVGDYLGGLSEVNKEHYQQMTLLKAMHEEFDYPPINLQILIVTWGKSTSDVMRHSASISDVLKDWGGTRMEYDNISPFQTYFTSIPGVNMTSHSKGCLIGAEKLVKMLPHQMESSLNTYGPIIFRHESGKVCAYAPNSEHQDYDYTQYIARPRQGKSLMMNTKSFANLMQEGVDSFPLITNVDIGPSSEGSLQLIRRLLEKHYGREKAKRLVVSRQWNPSAGDWKLNPNDIRFGRNVPTAQELQFTLNFYASVCAEPDTGLPCEGGMDVLYSLIEKVFFSFTTRENSRKYNPAISGILNKYLNQFKIKTGKSSQVNSDNMLYKSYFELRDELFQMDCLEGASLAHRLAMPTVDDLIEVLSTDSELHIRYNRLYPNAVEKIIYKLRRHASSMPHLAGSTTLDLADAHIISFDLKPIVKESDDNDSRIKLFAEYLLAMNTGMSKFFIDESILQDMNPIYHQFWRKRINIYRNIDKCLNLDEWHALTIKKPNDNGDMVSLPVAGAAYLEWLIKQAPKWRLSINHASHSATDFTPTMKEKATNVFIYSGTTGDEVERLRNDFSLTDTQVKALKSLHGPNSEQGSQMLWLYSVNIPNMPGVRGSAKVEFLCKGSLLWGLNTSAKDLPHKLRLEAEYPDKPWLEALCKTFPKGSMDDYRLGLLEHLRESNIEAERASKGIEEVIYKKAVLEMKKLEYGEQTYEDAEKLKQSLS